MECDVEDQKMPNASSRVKALYMYVHLVLLPNADRPAESRILTHRDQHLGSEEQAPFVSHNKGESWRFSFGRYAMAS